MFIFIARHAWAGNFGDPGWPDDSFREVTPEGAVRYTRVIKALAKRGLAPQRIASSPYVRCQQTAQIVAAETNLSPTIDELDALAPGASLQGALEWTAEQGERDVCWVGHNPDVEWLTAALIGEGPASIRFAKGAIAAVRFRGEVAPGLGELYWHATAKSLGIK